MAVTAVGAYSLVTPVFGDWTTAIGATAGYANGGTKCTFVGAAADGGGANRTQSTAIGYGSQLSADHQIMMGTASEDVHFPGTTSGINYADISGAPSGVSSGHNVVNSSVPNADTVIMLLTNANGIIGSGSLHDVGGAGLFLTIDMTDMAGNTTHQTSVLGGGQTLNLPFDNLPAIWAGSAAGPMASIQLKARAPGSSETYQLQYSWVGP